MLSGADLGFLKADAKNLNELLDIHREIGLR